MATTDLIIDLDVSAFEIVCDQLGALMDADPRRKPEAAPVWFALKERDELCTWEQRGTISYCLPSVALRRLYDVLRDRHRLDLPTMEAPDI